MNAGLSVAVAVSLSVAVAVSLSVGLAVSLNVDLAVSLNVDVVVSVAVDVGLSVGVDLYLELSRSWQRQGGIITLLALTRGNYHALDAKLGYTRIRLISTTISTLSTNGIIINLIPLLSLDSALFNGVKTLTCFLEKVSNLKTRT